MLPEPRLDHARQLDAADPLRAFRDRFELPRDERGEPLVYLAGHSLGLAPKSARARVLEELEDWARLGVLGHEHSRRPWLHYHEQLTAPLAALAGARAGEVIAMNALTINLHLMLASFYRPQGRRTKILMEAGAFPSDRHAVSSQIAWHGLSPDTELIELAPAQGADTLREADIEALLSRRGAEIALVWWPGVQYLTGQSFDLARIARAAREAGCVVGFDLAHSIGNVPLALHDSGADFAVWCGYKYLNGGPGALGGCFIAERHGAPGAVPRLSGWWGNETATRFQMRPQFQPAAGAAGWQVSNPPILSSAPLIASLEIFAEAGMARLRQKSLALSALLDELVRDLPVEPLTPRASAARGCQLSLRLPGDAARSERILERLTQRGVITDRREPDVLRVAPVPLYNRFEDVVRFADELAQALRPAS
ncbi:MAG TPA: kynureninase [Steroidobacteraceae bacterium]|nr:kynureninase [Steroidobacteraceae bacterium]